MEPTHERLYPLMGDALLIRTNYPTLLDVADDAFARFACDNAPPGARTMDDPLVLNLLVPDEGSEKEGSDNSVSPAQQTPDGRKYPKLRVRAAGHLCYITIDRDNSALLDLQSGFGVAYLTPAVANDHAYVRHTFVEAAAIAMSPGRGYVAIHAASVVKDGVCLLMQAPAGVGKSTLTYACLRHGYHILSEDVVHAKVTPDGIRFWSMPWRLHLLADSVRFFPELEGRAVRRQINGEWKVEVDVESLYPGATATNATPGAILFLERKHDHRPTHIERLPPAVAREKFELVWPWEVGWQPYFDEQFERLLSCEAYRMTINGSPDESVETLDDLVAQLR
jgi:hypothetical protein